MGASWPDASSMLISQRFCVGYVLSHVLPWCIWSLLLRGVGYYCDWVSRDGGQWDANFGRADAKRSELLGPLVEVDRSVSTLAQKSVGVWCGPAWRNQRGFGRGKIDVKSRRQEALSQTTNLS